MCSALAPLCFRSLSNSFSPATVLKFHRKDTGKLLIIPCFFLCFGWCGLLGVVWGFGVFLGFVFWVFFFPPQELLTVTLSLYHLHTNKQKKSLASGRHMAWRASASMFEVWQSLSCFKEDLATGGVRKPTAALL